MVWTAASLYWLMTAEQRIEPHTLLEWLRVVLLLPGVISVFVGQALYVWHGAPEEAGIVIGVAVGFVITCGISLTVARHA
jgi:hypothetical protein